MQLRDIDFSTVGLDPRVVLNTDMRELDIVRRIFIEEKVDLHSDVYFMGRALIDAMMGFRYHLPPIGCVVVSRDKIIAEAYAYPAHHPLDRPEILAIKRAYMYRNKEGFATHARLYTTYDPDETVIAYAKRAGINTVFSAHRGVTREARSLPEVQILYGPLTNYAAALWDLFFQTTCRDEWSREEMRMMRMAVSGAYEKVRTLAGQESR